MIEEIKKLKKIELHLHLDGSISPREASNLSGLNISLCKEKMIANKKCKDLTEYLEKFSFPISLMQEKENLISIAKNLVDTLEKENVIYAEIRFAPIFHIKNGLSLDDVVLSVLEGLRQNKNVKTNLILCMMRGISKEENLKVIELASKFLNKGVVALDLAGDENKYRLNEYLELFEIAKKKNIPFTIHVGEVDKNDVKDAISLGLKRIGHGVKIIDDSSLINLVKEKNILLEICPTSNIQTNAFLKYSNHPIYDLYKNKVNISINTDNMTVSNINLNKEYLNLVNNFNFTIKDLYKINKNSINYTFLSPDEKIKLLIELTK